MLISFDGLDSSGKATQARLLTEHLMSAGFQAVKFQSPDYETPSGKELKLRFQNKLGNWQETPWQEKMGYFAANRVEHREDVVSRISRGDIVIYDRYVPSSIAFIAVEAGVANAGDALRAEVRKTVEHLEYTENKMPKEDVSIFFDIPPTVAIDLLKKRKVNTGDADEYTDYLSVQETLHQEYVRMAEENPEHILRVACMDGDRLRSIDEVSDLVRMNLRNKFPNTSYFQ